MLSSTRNLKPTSRTLSQHKRPALKVASVVAMLGVGLTFGTAPQATAEPLSIPLPDGTHGNPFAQSEGATALITPELRAAGLDALERLPVTYDQDDPFYNPPQDIPQEAGSLIRQAQAEDLLGEVANDWPAKAQRILFTSTTTNNYKVATSGLVMEPKTPWTGEGERPTIVLAPGTRGAADVCAPSRGFKLAGGLQTDTMALGVNYEMPAAYVATALGARVIIPDYIGLGTPGPHTYVNHEEEGNAVLDGTRAGLKAAGAPVNSPVGFWGYSQGGGATASAAERASTYAPELNIRGTYAGAPPADLMSVMDSVDGNAIVGVLGMSLAGMADRFPQVQTDIVDNLLNEEGKRFVRETAEMCIPDAIVTWGARSTRNFTTTGETLAELAERLPVAGDPLRAQRLGLRPLTAPMLVQSGVNDDTVPYPQARQMAVDYCTNGGNVTFKTDPLPKTIPGTAINHAVPMLNGLQESLQFLFDRFNNVPVEGNCGQF